MVDPSQAFNIDAKSGWLSVRNQAKLDREQRSSLSMRVYAREKVPSVLDKMSEIRYNINPRVFGLRTYEAGSYHFSIIRSDPYTTVEVTLLDANDNNPMFLPSNIYEFNVSQDAPIGHIIGKVRSSNVALIFTNCFRIISKM